MELETIGKLMNESLALQGKLEANAKRQEAAQGALNAANKELERLETVQKQKGNATNSLADLKLEEKDLRKALDERMTTLEKEGVSLPFGKNQSGGVVRL